jgi:hypothetical protein
MAAAIPPDTTPAAHRYQTEVYLGIGGPGRVDAMFRLTESTRRLARAGIRARHPHYSDAEVFQAYARMMLGDALVRTVWPDRDLVDP